eukprot:1146161-Pelagomonas_calceolata.AAC.6
MACAAAESLALLLRKHLGRPPALRQGYKLWMLASVSASGGSGLQWRCEAAAAGCNGNNLHLHSSWGYCVNPLFPALSVLVPYLRSKAGQLHKLHAGEGVLGLALQNSASRQRAGDCDRQVYTHTHTHIDTHAHMLPDPCSQLHLPQTVYGRFSMVGFLEMKLGACCIAAA